MNNLLHGCSKYYNKATTINQLLCPVCKMFVHEIQVHEVISPETFQVALHSPNKQLLCIRDRVQQRRYPLIIVDLHLVLVKGVAQVALFQMRLYTVLTKRIMTFHDFGFQLFLFITLPHSCNQKLPHIYKNQAYPSIS